MTTSNLTLTSIISNSKSSNQPNLNFENQKQPYKIYSKAWPQLPSSKEAERPYQTFEKRDLTLKRNCSCSKGILQKENIYNQRQKEYKIPTIPLKSC